MRIKTKIKTRKKAMLEPISDPEIAHEGWFTNRWRPAMAWLFAGLVVYDFMVMPIFWLFLIKLVGGPFSTWTPLSLQSGGLVYMVFGVVLGLYTYTRSREKGMPEKPWKNRTETDEDDSYEEERTPRSARSRSRSKRASSRYEE